MWYFAADWSVGCRARNQRREQDVWAWLRGGPVVPCGPTCQRRKNICNVACKSTIACRVWTRSILGRRPRPSICPTHRPIFPVPRAAATLGSHGGKPTTDQCDRLHIRILHRPGSNLKPGAQFRFDGFQGRSDGGSLALFRRPASRADAQQRWEHAIQLLRTPWQRLVARGKWFRCPRKGCSRRVGILLREGRCHRVSLLFRARLPVARGKEMSLRRPPTRTRDPRSPGRIAGPDMPISRRETQTDAPARLMNDSAKSMIALMGDPMGRGVRASGGQCPGPRTLCSRSPVCGNVLNSRRAGEDTRIFCRVYPQAVPGDLG